MGNNSGVKPTAKATANKNDSSQGLWNQALTKSTNSTNTTVNHMINMPKRRVPSSKEVTCAGSAMLCAISPIAVCMPVFTTRILALPPITEVPMNTALLAS